MIFNISLCFNYRLLIVILVLFSSFVSFLSCDRIKSKIYKPIESNYFCFRRLNATNQIGCNSKENGNVGVVYVISTDEDMDYVLNTGKHYPYMAVITPKHLNLKSLNLFKQSSDRISGVLVLNTDDKNRSSELSAYSPDKTCPNNALSLYANDTTNYGTCAKQKWNLAGRPEPSEGLMFNDWPFPIFLVRNHTNINEIKDCFTRFGGPEWPLCAIEMEAPMNGAKDSITCIRRTAIQKSYSLSQTFYCDPLGGTNIFGTLVTTSQNTTIDDNSIIVVAARLDSFSMFDNISPGADSALTSVITLLSIAKTLNEQLGDIKVKAPKKNVLFALFDGEAFDYIGSSRTVFDMSQGKFPYDPEAGIDLAQIRVKHISHFIELNQLAPHDSADIQMLWMHKNINTTDPIRRLQTIIEENAKKTPNLRIRTIRDNRALPPSSLQTFLKYSNAMVGVVVANHENEFSNHLYNSLYDDMINVNKSDSNLSKRLTTIATVVSQSVYQLLTNDSKNFAANETLVEQLIECYLTNSACDLFKYVATPDQKFPTEKVEPLPTYVGVYRSSTLTTVSRLYTHMLLSYLTGEEQPNLSKDDCVKENKESQSYSYYWMASPSFNGTCVRSQAFKTEALSPSFRNDGEVLDRYTYSTWTESRWSVSSARMFIMPSALQQWLTLITGLIILIASFVLIYFLNKKSLLLFKSNVDITGPQQTLTTSAVSC